MNVQKMGALCKKNKRLKLAFLDNREYISDGITLIEMPIEFPTLPDECAAAAVFGWKKSVLEKIEVEMREIESSASVFGIDMRDAAQHEVGCVKAEVGFLVNGMKLIALCDDMGGIGFIDADQIAPVAEELINGEYMTWYKRKANGAPYYVLKNGLIMRLAVMPVTIGSDSFVQTLKETIDRMERKAVVTDAEKKN